MAASPNTTEALKRVEDQLECAVCLQTYTDPKLLACFHVFCRHCLEKMVIQDQEGSMPAVACPKCRQSTLVPKDGISTLQSAFHIHHLLDIRDILRKVKEPQKTQCEKCKEAVATDFCHECEKFVCAKCIEIHQKWEELATHRIVSIDDIQADASCITSSKVRYCSRHPDSVLKIYCETCKELICNDCTVRLHKEHQYDLVADNFPKHRDEIQAHLQPIREQLSLVNGALCNLDGEINEVRVQRLAIEADINRQIDQLHQALDQRREELVGQLEQLTQEKLKSLATQKDEFEMLQAQLSSCLEYVEGSLKTGTEGEILAMKAPVVKQIQCITSEINPDTLDPCEMADMHLVQDDPSRLIEICRNFAAIKIVDLKQCYATGGGLKTAKITERTDIRLHTKDRSGKSYEIEAENITAELLCCQTGALTHCDIRKVKDGEFNIRYWPSTHGNHQLGVMIWGRHTRNSPHLVIVQPYMHFRPLHLW